MNGHDLSLSRALAMQLYLLLLNILESSAPRRTIKMPIKLNESFYTIKYVRLYVISVEWRTVAVAVATAMTAFPAHKQRVVRGRRRIEYTDVLAMSLQWSAAGSIAAISDWTFVSGENNNNTFASCLSYHSPKHMTIDCGCAFCLLLFVSFRFICTISFLFYFNRCSANFRYVRHFFFFFISFSESPVCRTFCHLRLVRSSSSPICFFFLLVCAAAGRRLFFWLRPVSYPPHLMTSCFHCLLFFALYLFLLLALIRCSAASHSPRSWLAFLFDLLLFSQTVCYCLEFYMVW